MGTRNHYYLVASTTPELALTMRMQARTWQEKHVGAQTWIDDPEVSISDDPDDPTRVRFVVHYHILKAAKPKQVATAFGDQVAAWKAAGAEMIESRLDDDDLFEERPELKRRPKGEAPEKPMRVQRDELLDALQSAFSKSAIHEAARDAAIEELERLRAQVTELQVARDVDAAANRDALSPYERFVEAYRGYINGAPEVDLSDVDDAFDAFRSPDDKPRDKPFDKPRETETITAADVGELPRAIVVQE